MKITFELKAWNNWCEISWNPLHEADLAIVYNSQRLSE